MDSDQVDEIKKICAEMRQIRDEAKAEQEVSKAEAADLKAQLAAEKARAKAEADVLRRRLNEAEREKEKEKKDRKERKRKEEEEVEKVAVKSKSRKFKDWTSKGDETRFEDVDSMVFNFKDRILPPAMDNIAKACILLFLRSHVIGLFIGYFRSGSLIVIAPYRFDILVFPPLGF